jgi:hypothetical protein
LDAYSHPEDARALLMMAHVGKLATPVLTLTDASEGTPAVHNDRVPVWGASVNRDHRRVSASFNQCPRASDAMHGMKTWDR